MTAPERLRVPFAWIATRPASCPPWLFEAYQMAASGKRTWSWYWLTCALDVYGRDAFTSMNRRYQAGEPISREADPDGWRAHSRDVTANADNVRELTRFRCALLDHDEPEALDACNRALATFKTWRPPKWMTWFNAEMRAVLAREACRHGFQVRWAGDECPEGCR